MEAALSASHIAILDWDLESGSIVLSPGWKRQLGYQVHELADDVREWQQRLHPEDRGRVLRALRDFSERPWPDARIELRMRHRDGGYRWVLVQVSALVDASGKTCRIIAEQLDITERKRGEARLLGQAQVLELVARGAPLATTFERLVRLIEAQDDRVLGSILVLDAEGRRLRHGAAPSLPSTYTDAIDGLAIGESAGSCGTAAFRGAPVVVADIANDPLWKVYRDLALAHGLRACWSTPVFDAERRVLGTIALYFREPGLPSEAHRQVVESACHIAAIAIAREREERALRESEAQYLQAQKLESLGRLAAGVAHDFNNVLTVITAVTELALTGVTPVDRLRADMAAIADATKRGVEITRQLLTFARKQTANPVPIDVNLAIRSISKMLARLVGEEVEVVTELASGELVVTIDPIHFDQAIVNLVTNARDAMGDHGRIAIATGARTVAAGDPDRPDDVPPGDFVVVRVTDSGAGMDESTRRHIFEPFFTTKPPERGTGLGLALVSSIVAKQGGFIDLSSAKGSGSRFTLHFPRSSTRSVREAERTPAPERRGVETVLVAEDDPMLLHLVRRTLQSFGFRVITADSASSAQAASQAEGGDIQLLLTDTVMPITDGKTLYQALAPRRPKLKVLYMSGYPIDELVRRSLLVESDPFLQKPFTPSMLIDKLRLLLDT